MGNYVFLNICLYTEGTTDIRFLENIVQQTYERAAIQAYGEIDIELHVITINKTGLNFTQQVLKAAQKAKQEYGATIICVHSDADSSSIDNTLNTKFVPAQRCLLEQENDSCSKILVNLIPVHMTEAWILADKRLLKQQIGTTLSDTELNLNKDPESISNPKQAIENAIRIARQNIVKRRRRNLGIGELYAPLGQLINIDQLMDLKSYRQFWDNVINSLKQLNLMRAN